MKLGIIGAGQIGATLIRHYSKAGHEVKFTNASGIEKLKALETETGAKAVPLAELTTDIDVLFISIPFIEIPKLANQLHKLLTDNTIIIDTTNYYPIRDGRIADVEHGMPESVWVAKQLNRLVIKVYNSILAGSLLNEAFPAEAGKRIALPLSGNSEHSKAIVARLLNDIGFDALDIGDLANSWRQQPGSPIYCTDLNLQELKNNLENIRQELLPERRELALQFILKQNFNNWSDWYKACVANNRLVYKTLLSN